MTCWRRSREWQLAGVWDRLHRLVLDRLGQRGLLDWSRAAVDSVIAGAESGCARRGVEDSTRLGRVRWVVELTISWLLSFRRLALRYDRGADTVTALLTLACALICHRRLQ